MELAFRPGSPCADSRKVLMDERALLVWERRSRLRPPWGCVMYRLALLFVLAGGVAFAQIAPGTAAYDAVAAIANNQYLNAVNVSCDNLASGPNSMCFETDVSDAAFARQLVDQSMSGATPVGFWTRDDAGTESKTWNLDDGHQLVVHIQDEGNVVLVISTGATASTTTQPSQLQPMSEGPTQWTLKTGWAYLASSESAGGLLGLVCSNDKTDWGLAVIFPNTDLSGGEPVSVRWSFGSSRRGVGMWPVSQSGDSIMVPAGDKTAFLRNLELYPLAIEARDSTGSSHLLHFHTGVDGNLTQVTGELPCVLY